MTTASRRRVGGWGFEGVTFEPSVELLSWLESRLGPATTRHEARELNGADSAEDALPALPCPVLRDPWQRLAHARGQALPDILRLRSGALPPLPVGVCEPTSENEVQGVLEACANNGLLVIPWGGGTSVTGGVNVPRGEAPVLSLDLGRMAGLLALDTRSGLARFGPGTSGPEVERALAEHGLTLGHFPQSWELATVGGWVATRSSGQESLGYGRIEDMVAGLTVVAPAGTLCLPALPASAAGPDLRQLVMGSEGRLGVITDVTLRVRPRPERTEVEAALIEGFDQGLELARTVLQCGLPLNMLRLSDPAETQVAMTVGLRSSAARGMVERYLRLRGIRDNACLVLYGSVGSSDSVRNVLACVRSLVRRHGGISIGRRPGRHWLRDRFRHPYLRDALLDRGYATDTLETAAPWSAAASTRRAVGHAIANALTEIEEAVAVLCHVSHPYRDGSSLYFTFFYRCGASCDESLHRWAQIKRRATEALVEAGATLSHHHGVGQWHAPWLEREVGKLGTGLLAATAHHMDPLGILNPHVLLETTDRLEE